MICQVNPWLISNQSMLILLLRNGKDMNQNAIDAQLTSLQPHQYTDSFWQKEMSSSPVSLSTVDNYDEEQQSFLPVEETKAPETQKTSGIFRLIGGSLYKVD